MKNYTVNVQVRASGFQTWAIDAESEEEAVTNWENGIFIGEEIQADEVVDVFAFED